MPTTLETEALQTYSHVMAEVKIRLEWIEFAANGHTRMSAPMVREFGYLQLRMICELIALGCLVAHGDIEATRSGKFQRETSANDILNGLESLHADFYPKALLPPVRTGNHVHFARRTPGTYMTKAELLKLYGQKCGTALHRGNLKRLLTPTPPIQKHFPEIIEPAQRIANLLSVHSMSLYLGDTQFMCWMDYNQTGRPHVAIAEARPPEAGGRGGTVG